MTTYFKEPDWLLKYFYQSENGYNSYHGEQNRGYHVVSETGVKSDPAFCLEPTIEKTKSALHGPSFCMPIIKLAKIIMPAELLKVTGVHC